MLLTPPVFFGDNLEKFNSIYKYIKSLSEKYRKYPEIYSKWEKLEKEYLDLYERTKAKEKNLQEKTENRPKKPFYFTRMPNRRCKRIFSRLRHKSTRISKSIGCIKFTKTGK